MLRTCTTVNNSNYNNRIKIRRAYTVYDHDVNIMRERDAKFLSF